MTSADFDKDQDVDDYDYFVLSQGVNRAFTAEVMMVGNDPVVVYKGFNGKTTFRQGSVTSEIIAAIKGDNFETGIDATRWNISAPAAAGTVEAVGGSIVLTKLANAAGDGTTSKEITMISKIKELMGDFDVSIDWETLAGFDLPGVGVHGAGLVIEKDANNRVIIERTSNQRLKATMIVNGIEKVVYDVPAGDLVLGSGGPVPVQMSKTGAEYADKSLSIDERDYGYPPASPWDGGWFVYDDPTWVNQYGANTIGISADRSYYDENPWLVFSFEIPASGFYEVGLDMISRQLYPQDPMGPIGHVAVDVYAENAMRQMVKAGTIDAEPTDDVFKTAKLAGGVWLEAGTRKIRFELAGWVSKNRTWEGPLVIKSASIKELGAMTNLVNNGQFRLQRVGDQFTAYYSASVGGVWQTFGTWTGGWQEDSQLKLMVSGASDSQVSAKFDNLTNL